MSCGLLNTLLQAFSSHPRWPMLFYAGLWTAILTVTVAVASFTPELAFVAAIHPNSACGGRPGSVRLPLDVPSELFCFPVGVLKRSKADMIVPPVFAAVIVAVSACLVKAMGLWEVEEEEF